MAKIGLENFRYSKLTEGADGTPTYDGAKKPAKAISCSVDIKANDAALYADNSLAESDTSFSSGTVKIGLDEDNDEMMCDFLGHTKDTDGKVIRNRDDIAPYVGFGRIINKMVNGALKYKVEFLYKVKFKEPSQEEETKGESLSFKTPELEGTVATLANGDWSVTETFESRAEAITFLEGLMTKAA